MKKLFQLQETGIHHGNKTNKRGIIPLIYHNTFRARFLHQNLYRLLHANTSLTRVDLDESAGAHSEISVLLIFEAINEILTNVSNSAIDKNNVTDNHHIVTQWKMEEVNISITKDL